MQNLGSRYDFHTHTTLSDGTLLPVALIQEAENMGYAALGIADHVDASNLENVIKPLVKVEKELKNFLSLKFIPGVEISYMPANLIETYCRKAKKLGAKLIIVHGQSPSEPAVPRWTNSIAVKLKGIVNILAHPGYIKEEDVIAAAQNGIFLELSAKPSHKEGNNHVASFAKKHGAKLIVNTDAHNEQQLITQEQAFNVAKDAGLSEEEALIVVRDNPKELLRKIGYL